MMILIVLVPLLITVAFGCVPFNDYFYETQVGNETERIFVIDRRFFKDGAVNAKRCNDYGGVCDLVFRTYQRFNNPNDFQVHKEGRFVLFKTKKFLVVVAKPPNTREP